MSSLAGALDEYPLKLPSDDVEMTAASSPKEDDDAHERNEEMDDDLFGHDHDQEARPAAASPTASGPDSDRLPSPERERRQALEYEEDDVPPEIAVEVKEAEVTFPNLPVPKSSDGNNWVVRMPNFVKVDTKPFHPDTYIGPEQEDEENMQGDTVKERSMTIKLKVENTLRWRWTKDENGQDKRESNSRVIRWSDGTLSLRLGKEYFDITQSIDTSAGVSRQSLGGSQSQPSQSQTLAQSQSQSQSQAPPQKSEGLTYLVAQHKRSQVLQSEALITGYMSLRPTGMQSETHRMLVRAVGQKHNKVARLRIAPEPTVDPEREKLELMKQSAKKSKKRAEEDGFGAGGRRRRGGYRRQTDTDVLWSDDEEEERGMYAGSEEEYEDGGGGGTPRKPKRKPQAEKGGEEYQADDFVVPDESDEDGEGAPKKKRARDASPQDDLERMEASLEKQAAADRKSRGGDSKKSKKKEDEDEDTPDEDAEAAMDVESEEEEEEFKVRRVTSKRAITFDEDEE